MPVPGSGGDHQVAIESPDCDAAVMRVRVVRSVLPAPLTLFGLFLAQLSVRRGERIVFRAPETRRVIFAANFRHFAVLTVSLGCMKNLPD